MFGLGSIVGAGLFGKDKQNFNPASGLGQAPKFIRDFLGEDQLGGRIIANASRQRVAAPRMRAEDFTGGANAFFNPVAAMRMQAARDQQNIAAANAQPPTAGASGMAISDDLLKKILADMQANPQKYAGLK